MLCIIAVSIANEKVKKDADAISIEEILSNDDIKGLSTGPAQSPAPTPAPSLENSDAMSLLELESGTAISELNLECKTRAAAIRQFIMYWGFSTRAEDDGSCEVARTLVQSSKCTIVPTCPVQACMKAGFLPEAP